MASAQNSQSEAARVMSENTIVTSPSGGRTPPAPAVAATDPSFPKFTGKPSTTHHRTRTHYRARWETHQKRRRSRHC